MVGMLVWYLAIALCPIKYVRDEVLTSLVGGMPGCLETA